MQNVSTMVVICCGNLYSVIICLTQLTDKHCRLSNRMPIIDLYCIPMYYQPLKVLHINLIVIISGNLCPFVAMCQM